MLSIQGLVQIVKAPSTYVDLFIQKEGEQRKSYLTYVFYRMVPTNCTDVKRAKGIYFFTFLCWKHICIAEYSLWAVLLS